MKCCVWSIALCGDDALTLLEVRQKHLGGFEMCWTDHVGNEVLHTVKEKRNILHTVAGISGSNPERALCR
jgi:hypothetical protein